MRCEKCGKESAEGARFCTGCGAPIIKAVTIYNSPNAGQKSDSERLSSVAQGASGGQKEEEKIYIQKSIPDSHTPISMWGYLGYEILFSIPCVGIICLIIFALGGTSNVNVRNFARSYFCFIIILFIFFVIILSTGVVLPPLLLDLT